MEVRTSSPTIYAPVAIHNRLMQQRESRNLSSCLDPRIVYEPFHELSYR